MTFRPLILLIVLLYLLALWVTRRLRRARFRKKGLPPEGLSEFDHAGFLDELSEIYEAGLPAEETKQVRSRAKGEASVSSASKIFSQLPSWFREDVWSSESAGVLPGQVLRARELIEDGKEREVDSLVEDGQEPEVDQAFASLGIHFFVKRLCAGDLDGAESVMRMLPSWTRDRISWRIAEKHAAQIELLRAMVGGSGAKKGVKKARQAIRRAGGGGRYADTGTLALWAHLTLVHGRNILLEELLLLRVDYALRKGLSQNSSSPLLFYELAHCCLWRSRQDEAIDHLARALFFSGGSSFYTRPILESPVIARIKPALVKQARARVESFGSPAPQVSKEA